MTTKIHSMQNIYEMLGLKGTENFEQIKSFLGYEHCIIFDGVRIHWTDNLKLYEVCIDLSGKGCRTIEFLNENQFDWFQFFSDLDFVDNHAQVNISRLDVACDDLDGVLDYDTLCDYTKERKYICKATCEPWWTFGRKKELVFGSEHSDRLLRIYDKALEQRNMLKKKHPELMALIPEHWIRAEFQLRDDNALSFLMNWLKVNDLGKCYSGTMNDYLRFVTKTVDSVRLNYQRYNTTRWWVKFLGSAEKLKKCYIVGREYTISSIYEYLDAQAGSSLKTVLEADEGDISRLMEIVEKSKLNQKQSMALTNWRLEKAQQKDRVAEIRSQQSREHTENVMNSIQYHMNNDMLSESAMQFIRAHEPDAAQLDKRHEQSQKNLEKLRAELFGE